MANVPQLVPNVHGATTGVITFYLFNYNMASINNKMSMSSIFLLDNEGL